MKSILTAVVAIVFLSSIIAAASAADVLDLSTINKKSKASVLTLPQISPTMPTIAPTALGGDVESNVMDLSTLGKKIEPAVPATVIKGASPITVTPMFAVKNADAGNLGGTVFTLPQAVSSGASVITPPIAIFGGA
ncbi:MAG: hypothetical protein IPI63_01625 [Methanothrix sp.]|jgi:hypothetical protein|uniref:hypothetical protein n=2 Tax=Methanothrix sp. TaxID=90426 RepID=UPI001BD2BECD|nr:hypothetical protein [Methanothrix sp.]MBK7385479.1 hypothetical protein [Methanothrix sp.]HPW74199.1 hypothetical protein [Methanothrix sp.]